MSGFAKISGMMVKSMTGFGRGSAKNEIGTVTVELSSVNRKQLDASIWLPREWMMFEPRVLGVLKRTLVRGAVKCSISVQVCSVSDGMSGVVSRFAQLQTVARSLGVPANATFSDLVALSGAGEEPEVPPPTEEMWRLVETAMHEALVHLQQMREHEGVRIAEDLRARFRELRTIYSSICAIAPILPGLYRETLRKRIAELLSERVAMDNGLLEREVALFADRCDISEELTRLEAHFEHAETLLSGETPCGRPLDFLCQEFFREINTTGSKCASNEISRQVIAFKTLLETVREQVQNLE